MIKYVLLGIVQGITEFIPVSSSGHLVILQKILGISAEGIIISLVLHLGTALALIIFFFKDILLLLRNIRMMLLILLVSLLTFIIAFSGKDFFEVLFSSPRFVAEALIVTGIVLIATKKFMQGRRNNITAKDALILGIVQGLAVIPGISRSGVTISALLFRKIDKETSFRFSFLASIPAVLGAVILKAKDIGAAARTDFNHLIIGFIFSFFFGILSLRILKILVEKAKLYYFGYYCIAVAALTLLFLR